MIDFESTFDRVLPALLLLQCAEISIKGKLLQFIHNVLQDKIIEVKVNNSSYQLSAIGVP